jgi:hypothetical protein
MRRTISGPRSCRSSRPRLSGSVRRAVSIVSLPERFAPDPASRGHFLMRRTISGSRAPAAARSGRASRRWLFGSVRGAVSLIWPRGRNLDPTSRGRVLMRLSVSGPQALAAARSRRASQLSGSVCHAERWPATGRTTLDPALRGSVLMRRTISGSPALAAARSGRASRPRLSKFRCRARSWSAAGRTTPDSPSRGRVLMYPTVSGPRALAAERSHPASRAQPSGVFTAPIIWSPGRTSADPPHRGCTLMRPAVSGPRGLAGLRRTTHLCLPGSVRRAVSRSVERRNGSRGCAPAARRRSRGGGVFRCR